MTAEEIIDLRNRELSAQGNVRSLWQSAADKLYPYINITTVYASGEPRTNEIYNQTPMLDCEDMVSGLKQVLIPSGQNVLRNRSKEQQDYRYFTKIYFDADGSLSQGTF